MSPLYLRILARVLDGIKFATYLYMGLIVIAIVTSFIMSADASGPLIHFVNQVGQSPTAKIESYLPDAFHGTIVSKLILLILAYGFIRAVTYSAEAVRNYADAAEYEQDQKEYKSLRKKMDTQLSKEKVLEMDVKFRAITSAKKSDRKKLLSEFAALKNKLDHMGQNLAFLAIDVVDSTGMKRDEDKHIAAFDFDRYNVIVNECLKKNGVVKFATTPDGVMSCFRTVDNAVQAASALLEALIKFNKNEKQMKRDFEIRCGINAGFVYLDEETPLEQITDRVIDIAGHMQKHAKPNCINIAASAIEPLKLREGFNETNDVIDEQRVYEWNWKK